LVTFHYDIGSGHTPVSKVPRHQKEAQLVLMLLFLSVTPAVLSQAQLPSLEQTRLAAERAILLRNTSSPKFF